MMGRQGNIQRQLFYHKVNLDKRIRQDHILRKVDAHINFDFVYNEVATKYGANGNVSVPPPVTLKMMFLLIFYNVRSEREMMNTIPERLDWLWFLGYDLDDEIPNHSILSKARSRWGVEAFQSFFERIVRQCVEAGLVDGSKLFMDSSLIQADASNNSVVKMDSLKRYLRKGYQILESRLDDAVDESKSGNINKKHISTTDPDASVTRHGNGLPSLQYQVHRGVDSQHEVITATKVTPGEVHEAHCLEALITTHEENTGKTPEIAVADSKYGTIDNYLACHDRGIKAHIPSLESTQENTGRKKGIYPKEAFTYDAARDVFICPAGNELRKRKLIAHRNHYEYIAASRICRTCHLRAECSRSKSGRTVKRHVRQEELDRMLQGASSRDSQKDIKTRQHLMERSFARSTRYGFKRARWRRDWRVEIQEYLTAAIQNISILLRYAKEPASGVMRIRKGTHYETGLSDLIGNIFANMMAFRSKNFWPLGFKMFSLKMT
jgi:transposase